MGSGSDSRLAAAIAFASLIAVQVALAVAFKAAQRADGSYAFSPPSLLVASEVIKLLLSVAAYSAQALASEAAPASDAPIAVRARFVATRLYADTFGGGGGGGGSAIVASAGASAGAGGSSGAAGVSSSSTSCGGGGGVIGEMGLVTSSAALAALYALNNNLTFAISSGRRGQTSP